VEQKDWTFQPSESASLTGERIGAVDILSFVGPARIGESTTTVVGGPNAGRPDVFKSQVTLLG
jgi:hypothetical protein